MYNLNACSHYFTLVQTFSVFYGACCATTGGSALSLRAKAQLLRQVVILIAIEEVGVRLLSVPLAVPLWRSSTAAFSFLPPLPPLARTFSLIDGDCAIVRLTVPIKCMHSTTGTRPVLGPPHPYLPL